MPAYQESLNLAITGLNKLRETDRLIENAARNVQRFAEGLDQVEKNLQDVVKPLDKVDKSGRLVSPPRTPERIRTNRAEGL